jgi:hypothetical protein
VVGSDHFEVLVVEGGDLGLVKTFGKGDDARIGSTEREVGVLLHELSRSAARPKSSLVGTSTWSRASAAGPPARSIMNVASATTIAGTINRPGVSVDSLLQASWSGSLRLAAATSGPVSMITRRRSRAHAEMRQHRACQETAPTTPLSPSVMYASPSIERCCGVRHDGAVTDDLAGDLARARADGGAPGRQ